MSDTITLSLFESARDALPKSLTTTWDAFVRELGPHQFDRPSKDVLPAFSPAQYKEGSTRLAKNVRRVSFGVLDLDKITGQQFLNVIDALDPYDALVYSTWSHPKYVQQGLWCVRVCIRLNRPVEMAEWRLFWPALVGTFGNLSDPQCKDPNRIYYGAFAPDGTQHEAIYYVNKGKPLEVESLSSVKVNIESASYGTDKIPRDRLERLAIRWKRSRDEWRSTMGETLHKLCQGQPFAEEGHVDTTVFQLCNDLAEAFPTADPASIAPHFAQSLQLMNYKGIYPLEKVEDKLRRALANQAAEVAAKQEEEVTERKLRIRQAFAHIDPTRDYPYTEKELEAMTLRLDCSRDELAKRWIIQRGNLFYLLGPGARYSEPYSEKDVINALTRDLAPASSAGVEIWSRTPNGDPIRKGITSLMNDYGSVATNYVLDMRAQEARYEPSTKLFIEAPCPLRPLTPAYDLDVDRWLSILCHTHYHDVKTWLALVTSLEEVCAALLLTGHKGVGKSLLAEGIARLWTTNGSTKLTSAMGDFNDAIARCPLVFADEQLPKDYRGGGRTAEIREFIAARTRPFKKKYAPETSILGATRLIIAANNEDILAIQENLSVNDIEAIGDRFYHVKVNPFAEEFIDVCDPKSMIYEDRIARHCLWLRDNHPIERNGRFLIKSTDRQFHRALTTKTGLRSALCQWLIGYLKSPKMVDARKDWGVWISRGRLLVTTKTILENWETYVTNEHVPPTGRLAGAISGLSHANRIHVTRPDATTGHYRMIDIEHLYAWGGETEFATREEIDAALRIDTEHRK